MDGFASAELGLVAMHHVVETIGADDLHVTVEMGFHLIDRELRGRQRRRAGIVTVRAGHIGHHADLQFGAALRAQASHRRQR